MPLLVGIALFFILDFIVLFTVGAKIGLAFTLIWIIASLFLGVHLIRKESFATLLQARDRFTQGEVPSNELFSSAAFAFAGVLLILPGFLSDVLGLLCLLPTTKILINRYTKGGEQSDEYSSQQRFRYQSNPNHYRDTHTQQQNTDPSQPLEGDFIERDDRNR